MHNNTDPSTVATAVTNHDDEEMSCLTEPAYQPDPVVESDSKAGDNDNAEESTEEEEPNWEEIMKHEPARTEVPTFLSGRERKEAASDSLMNYSWDRHIAPKKFWLATI